MNALNPLALAFALLAIPIILLYLLKLQRREQSISSTFLWRQVTLDREANALWQRLRRHLLLFLQLLTLAFFVFALVRPYINAPATFNGMVVVLLDASASMRATDVAPTRFEAAKAEARALINQLGGSDQMVLIQVDGAPRALTGLTNDRAQLAQALDATQPSLNGANWPAAISLAAATAANQPNATTIVISDGAAADDIKLIQGRARHIAIGQRGDNIAITAMSLRRTLRGLAAFARISNVGAQDDRVLVSLRADGALSDARELSVPAGKSVEFVVNGLPATTLAVEARLDQGQFNALPDDDVAYAVNTANSTRNALLLTNGNRFLEQALVAMPGLRVTRAITPPLGTPQFDLYVLDRLTMTLPARSHVLAITANPSIAGADVFSTSGVFSDTQFVRVNEHPILRQVDWRGVNVLDAQRVNAPVWLRPVVQAQGGPLLFAGETTSENAPERMVLLPFELRKSDLPLQIAYPLLIANSVDWLAPAQGVNAPPSVRPGEVVALPEGAAVTLPSGDALTVDKRGFAQTGALGVYRFTGASAGVRGAFAVNMLNPSESAIAPSGEVAIGSATANAAAPAANGQSPREFWNLMAALALVLLVIEWWIYQRGVPAFRRAR